ncbi:hypothetical protein [Klebsiella oxytoca]|uniref:hypothetical protein n=1 Tax=Klebsiella oxytoca TaxID=571 RepID=UPI00115B479D|nr:hypothetical protein [Klebsiella oxytoca]
MTSKLTRERLEKIKSWRETYGAGSNVILPAEEAEELARMALAAMDSEPVGEFYEDGPLNWYQISDGDRVPDSRRIPLYRHAQPSLVPDKMNYQDGVLFVLNNDMFSIERGTVAMRAWNACRAAMLQAGNSPVIPDGYVMVPESVTPAMAVAGGDMFVKSEQVSEYPTDAARNIYRAMLAAAPQEVK